MKKTTKELEKLAEEMIFQMTMERVPKEERCEKQGNAKWQIAMYYLRLVNGDFEQ